MVVVMDACRAQCCSDFCRYWDLVVHAQNAAVDGRVREQSMKAPTNLRLATRVIAVAYIFIDIILRNSRLHFRPEVALKKIDQPAVTSLDSKSNLTDACNVGSSKSG